MSFSESPFSSAGLHESGFISYVMACALLRGFGSKHRARHTEHGHPTESNYLLNPLHRDFRRIRAGKSERFETDLRRHAYTSFSCDCSAIGLIAPPIAFQAEWPPFMYFASKPASRSMIAVLQPTWKPYTQNTTTGSDFDSSPAHSCTRSGSRQVAPSAMSWVRDTKCGGRTSMSCTGLPASSSAFTSSTPM